MYMEIIPCWEVKWLEGSARITRTLRVNDPDLKSVIDTLLFNQVKHIEITLEERGPETNVRAIA